MIIIKEKGLPIYLQETVNKKYSSVKEAIFLWRMDEELLMDEDFHHNSSQSVIQMPLYEKSQ